MAGVWSERALAAASGCSGCSGRMPRTSATARRPLSNHAQMHADRFMTASGNTRADRTPTASGNALRRNDYIRKEADMNATAAIALGISIASFLLGISCKLADLSLKFGRMMKTLEANEDRDSEERRMNSARFSELFNDRNRHEATITRLDTTIGNIDSKLEKVDGKLDRILHGIVGRGGGEAA